MTETSRSVVVGTAAAIAAPRKRGRNISLLWELVAGGSEGPMIVIRWVGLLYLPWGRKARYIYCNMFNGLTRLLRSGCSIAAWRRAERHRQTLPNVRMSIGANICNLLFGKDFSGLSMRGLHLGLRGADRCTGGVRGRLLNVAYGHDHHNLNFISWSIGLVLWGRWSETNKNKARKKCWSVVLKALEYTSDPNLYNSTIWFSSSLSPSEIGSKQSQWPCK